MQELGERGFSIIGKDVARVDAVDKVSGRAKYGADYFAPGQLYGAVRYTDFPHAIIKKIRLEKARAIEGVRAVLTSDDIPGRKTFGAVFPHQPVLCGDKVRFYGDAVAVVAADTEEIAHFAASQIEIDYDPLPVLDDPTAALSPDSYKIHGDSNICTHHQVRKGDVERGFADSALVIEREFSTQRVEHAYIEPEAVLAEPGENGGITIIGSVQNLFNIRRAVASVLGLPLHRTRIIQATLGGSFGGKDEVMSVICCRAALLALATGRPVKIVNSRENSMRESYKRHPYRMKYKVGVSSSGILQAMEISIVADAGAYAAMSPFVTWRSAVQATGPYVVPHVKTDVYAVYTNNCYTSAMRGFGSPQICFAAESLIDELADLLNLDPLEFRLRNVLRDGSVTATGQKLTHKVSVGQALKAVADRADYSRKRVANRAQAPDIEIRKGIGISCSYRGVSLGAEGTDAVGVGISVQSDGTVVVFCGLVDMGQGAATTISIIVAEELGITTDKIRFLNADTTAMPDSGPTVASRTTLMAGNAARDGCRQLLARLKPVASSILGCPESELIMRNNSIHSARDESGGFGSLDFAELARICFQKGIPLFSQGWFKAPPTSWDETSGQGDAYFTYVYGANLAEVEVDTVTGQVRVVRFVSAHDLGRTINRGGALGQVFGGVAMGLGYGLLEHYAEHKGIPALENFDEYLLATACDMPEMEVVFIENPDELGPYGAKTLGEPACELAAPAIANAVANATGLRCCHLPLTLERVLLGTDLGREDERGSVKSRSASE